ncbi:MAG: YggS family pyridoxal phosphate-dependent enzyme [Lachnospiraceae bacterium]|nr:YggS family pyridoxal phosphate-dependent enzyme [Lachnospiraceae bacterium]
MLQENYKTVQQKIRNACNRCGREYSEVTLIVVGKTQSVEMLQKIYDLNHRDFGENKVQELMCKYEVMQKDIRWHLIGHLQQNKVKYIVDKTCLIHSIDSLRLAETISKEAGKHNRTVPVLIEVNVSDEKSKFGVKVSETLPLIETISSLPGISIQGLMSIAPYVTNPQENRPVFKKLKKLSVDIENKNINNVTMNVLSMGMTNDYEVAIEEGATIVRVGTGIFGERYYKMQQ